MYIGTLKAKRYFGQGSLVLIEKLEFRCIFLKAVCENPFMECVCYSM